MKNNFVLYKGMLGEIVKETASKKCYIIRIWKYPEGCKKIENDMTVVRKSKVVPIS